MEVPKVRNRFSPRVAVIHRHDGVTRTQVHFQDGCNINNILKKYKKTGVIEHVNRARAMYGDFSEYKDVAQNLDKTAKAVQLFESLPAELRNEFKNSIPGFFEFVGDAKNFDRCVELGIFDKPAPPPPAVESAGAERLAPDMKASSRKAAKQSEDE